MAYNKMQDKQYYEKLILESPIFSLDREKEPIAYQREFFKISDYIFRYLTLDDNKKTDPLDMNCNYGPEIMEQIKTCINNFDSEKGNFIHYFNNSWKLQKSHHKSNNIISEKLHGIVITETEKRNVIRYLGLIKKTKDISSKEELYDIISQDLNIPIEKIYYIEQILNIQVKGSVSTGPEGTEINTFDSIPQEKHFEEDIIEREQEIALLDKIELFYKNLQERQKPLISDILSSKMWNVLSIEADNKYSFINSEIIKLCRERQRPLTQRELAEKYSRNEASISRTIHDISAKLKLLLRKE